MRFWGRSFLVALISCGLLNLQILPSAQAASSAAVQPLPGVANSTPAADTESKEPAKAFGIVILADHAHVSAADASAGATVYSGDSVDTGVGGELRLMIGKGQLYLLSTSAADLVRAGELPRASVVRGTVGFSSLTARQFVLDTPEGSIRAANDRPAYGQVTLTGPKEMTITAFSGALLLQRNDQQLEIEAGQSYDVALVPDPAAQGPAGQTRAYNDKLIWKLIVIAGAGLAGYFFWRHFSESPKDPK